MHELLPAALRARLKALRLVARAASGAHGLGQHSSRSRGVGLEFAQYRAYEPGDEPRRVDWKLYARSDRYFVRESERDSPLTAWIVLDATASMSQADVARADYTKLDVAKSLAAGVIELALRQGDRFAVVALSDVGIDATPAGSGPRHRDRCIEALLRWRAQGALPDESALRPLWERIPPASLVLFIGDFFDDALLALAERLAAARREVLAIQLIGGDERTFPFSGGHRFVDMESGAELRLDAARAREDYLKRFAAARRQWSQRLSASGIRHATQFLDEPLDASLNRLFGIRGAEGAEA
ncbi:MAG: DUF58 domain-containing protein [Tahibacter sp.]